jgi:hypothetical protein
MPQYVAFLPVLVATGWLLSSKAKIIENSSRAKINIHVVIVSAISFFFGLQISHLTALFQTDFGVGMGGFMKSDATKYMTWAPDEVEQAERQKKNGGERLPPPLHFGAQVHYLTVGPENQVNNPNHPATVTLNEAFSASWWASVSNFLRYESVETVSASPEGASFEFFIANIDKVRMTKDWLDYAVEHMSKWWKLIDHDGPALDRVIDILTKYTTTRRIINYGKDVPQETLVVIAYQPYAQTELTKWSLAATISSYVSVGIGRIIVSGIFPDEEELVLEAFDIVNKQFQQSNPTELSFCLALKEATGDSYTKFNVPKSALKKLQHVLLGNASGDDINCWLGEISTKIHQHNATKIVQSKWKYISLTEPDILLSTRPSSLVAMGEALKQGYVLAPHRLQPVPHGSDFKGLKIANDTSCLLPAAGLFEHVYAVDSNEMSCCDAGRFKPMTVFEPYDNFWWMSGFNKASSMPVEAAHKHLLPYPLIRLTSGTQVVFVGSEHGKLCHPQHGVGTC